MLNQKNSFEAAYELLAKKLGDYRLMVVFGDFPGYNLVSDPGHQATTDVNDFIFFILQDHFVALRLLAKLKVIFYLPTATSNLEKPPRANAKILMPGHVFEITKRPIYNCHLHFVGQVTGWNSTQRPTVHAQLANEAKIFHNKVAHSVHVLLQSVWGCGA